MAKPRELRCYDYVTRPYQRVRTALHERTPDLFQRATAAAGTRAQALAANLRVVAAGVVIGVDVRIQLREIRDDDSAPELGRVTRVDFAWEAEHASALFPTMEAQLSAWALSTTETQIELVGKYHPPLGVVGNAVDAVVGHRIAEATMHSFLADVVEQLKDELHVGS